MKKMRSKKMDRSFLPLLASIVAVLTTHNALGKLEIVGETTS
jgi:hypothetical protein